VFELETVLAFGVGAGLVALAPMVRRLGNPQLGDSMNHVGRSMAKGGIKVGVTVAGAAGNAARSVARHAAEAAESLGDLVAEARTELDTAAVEVQPAPKKAASSRAKKQVTVTDVTVD
jgi:replication-associated recombination protein RarA